MSISRHHFIALAVAAMAGALAGCGADATGPTPSGNCLKNGTHIDISNNHGHELVVPISDLTMGAGKTYDITGSANHTHKVTYSADNFVSLMKNLAVSATSTTALDHTHTVTVSCN